LIIKKILRAFRKEVKDQYVSLYGKKQYHWIETTCRRNLRSFFTSTKQLSREEDASFKGYQFSEEFFDRNEATLFILINNTKKEGDLKKLGIEHSSFLRVMDEVFG